MIVFLTDIPQQHIIHLRIRLQIQSLMLDETYTQNHLKDILDKRINSNSNCQEHTFQFRGRKYMIHPNVFSPVFFPNTHWFTNTLLDNMPEVETFLEIGTGAGNVLAEALISGKCKWAVGSDISQEAIENAKVNFDKLQLAAKLVVSDVLDGLDKSSKFDLIYWNYPFHYNFSKSYETMSVIEQGLRDPDYRHLQKLLVTAKQYLNSEGFIIVSFSLVLGNVNLMNSQQQNTDGIILYQFNAQQIKFKIYHTYAFSS